MLNMRRAELKRLKEVAKNGGPMSEDTRMVQTWKMSHDTGEIALRSDTEEVGVVVMHCPSPITLTRWEAEKLAKALVDVKNFGSMI